MNMPWTIRWLLVVAPVLITLTAFGADSANLVANPSFETAGNSGLPEGWLGDRSVYGLDTTVARTGKASLKFIGTDPKKYVLCRQKMALSGGMKVRISAWMKTQDITGDESGASLCLEWNDSAGKWMGGCYAPGVKGTRDWTRVEAVTRIPPGAQSFNLSCYARRGIVGQAWFDDVEVVRLIDPPMSSTLVWPNYRGRIPAGSSQPIKARVRLNLIDHPFEPKQLGIEAILRAAGGKVIIQGIRPPAAQPAPTDITIPVATLAPGTYELLIRVLDPAGREIQVERHALTQLAPGENFKYEIDAHRRLLADGKPVFPLGMYIGGIREADLKLFDGSRFNCIMAYGTPTRDQLDLAQKHSLKVIYSIKDWYFGTKYCPSFIKSVADEEPRVRQRVKEMRDHPAVMGWYLNDELGQEFLPQLEAHQKWVAEEDPQHPTWSVLYQVEQVRSYLKTFDVIGTDPYPIGRRPASMTAQWTRTTFEQSEQSRPMWQVPQVFNWGNYAKNEIDKAKGRTPTPQEMRSMAWQCICEGATGLIFYCLRDLQINPDAPFEKQWEALRQIVAEVDQHAPVLLSAEPVPSIACEGSAPGWLHWIVRRSGNKVFLFCVNDGDGEGRIAMRLPKAGDARELSDGRTIACRDGVLIDVLPKLAVRIYQWAAD